MEGMTLRQYFAAHAPETMWRDFQPVFDEPEPDSDWTNDFYFSKKRRAAAAQKRKAWKAWESRFIYACHTQWPWYYADAVLAGEGMTHGRMVMKKGYSKPVNFTGTGRHGCGPDDEDDVYTVEEFKNFVKAGAFIDYDGYGYPVKDSKADPSIAILPSRLSDIPADATHVVWFNR